MSTILGVVDLPRVSPPALKESVDELQEAMLESLRRDLKSLSQSLGDSPECEIKVLVGKRFIEIIRVVLREKIDLVMKTVEKPDGVRSLFGSTDMNLLRKCPCPL